MWRNELTILQKRQLQTSIAAKYGVNVKYVGQRSTSQSIDRRICPMYFSLQSLQLIMLVITRFVRCGGVENDGIGNTLFMLNQFIN